MLAGRIVRKRSGFGKGILYATVGVMAVMALLMMLRTVPGENCDVYARDKDGELVVVLDPGHGGFDGGAVSVLDDRECDLNWNIAKYMKAELETYEGVKVYVTRGNNEWNTNTGRAQLGQTMGADVIISIHNNSSINSATNGFVAYGSVAEGYVEVTKNLCLNMARYANAAGLNLFNDGYLTRPGNKTVDYYTVIDEGIQAGIPTIIAEHCFLSNDADAAYIGNPENQRKIGVADATAVAEFYGLSKRTVGEGESIYLDRSYSAYFIPNVQNAGAISFTSSDENVAHIRTDGLITAVNQGEAMITYTTQDGRSGSCKVITREVRQVGVAAGLNPTNYHSPEAVAAIDKSKIIVKALYSDGSCMQLSSGYTIGDIDPNIVGRQYINVYHNGFTCMFSIAMDSERDTGTYQEYLYQVKGDYSDIFTFPELVNIEGVSGSPYTVGDFETGTVVTVPGTTEAVTEPTTVLPMETTTQEVTEAQTEPATGQPTEALTEPATDTPTSDGTQATTQNVTQGTSQQEVTQNTTQQTASTAPAAAVPTTPGVSKKRWQPDMFLIVLIIIIVILAVCIVLASRSIMKNNRHNRGIKRRDDDYGRDGGRRNAGKGRELNGREPKGRELNGKAPDGSEPKRKKRRQ